MTSSLIVVDGVVPTDLDDTNIRDDPWSIALDQRVFGPRQLLVAFAERDGTFRGLAFTARTDPIDTAFECCLAYLGEGASAAIAYNDEPVEPGQPPPYVNERFERIRALARRWNIHLVDWIGCDDDMFRSSRFGVGEARDWWDVP